MIKKLEHKCLKFNFLQYYILEKLDELHDIFK